MAKTPTGKGKAKKKISPKKNNAIVEKKTRKRVITMDQCLQFLQSQGITVTEETVDQLAEIAKIPAIYEGNASDTSRQAKQLMIRALEKTFGVVAEAARIAGIGRATHYEWMNADQEYSDAVKTLNDVALDFCESRLFDLITEKDRIAIMFYLRTKGKKRGYIETIHNMNQNFEDNNVHYYIPENGREQIEEAKVVG